MLFIYLRSKGFFFLCFIAFLLLLPSEKTLQAQNITPKPNKNSVLHADDKDLEPTPLRRYEVEMEQITDARVEVITDTRIIFSEHTRDASANRRLYVWEIEEEELWDTLEDAVEESVIAPEDGRYMLFLHNEQESGRDIDGDRVYQTVLRMYHFETGQKINLGIPARSATPLPGENRSRFEYELNDDNIVVFSVSYKENNLYLDREAPWNIVDLKPVLEDIEENLPPTGSPTPTKSPTPTPSATPTPPPSPTPTHTLTPTPIPPEESLLLLEVNFELEKIVSFEEKPKLFGNNVVVGRHQDAVVVTQKEDKESVTWYVREFVKDIVETTHGRKIASINYAGSNAISILIENTITEEWELYQLQGAFEPAEINDYSQY